MRSGRALLRVARGIVANCGRLRASCPESRGRACRIVLLLVFRGRRVSRATDPLGVQSLQVTLLYLLRDLRGCPSVTLVGGIPLIGGVRNVFAFAGLLHLSLGMHGLWRADCFVNVGV